MVVSQTVFSSSGRSGSDDFSAAFWQLWEQYRDEPYRYCIKWIGGFVSFSLFSILCKNPSGIKGGFVSFESNFLKLAG